MKSFIRDEDGPTTAEYAVMLALMVIVVVGALSTFTGSIGGLFQSVADATSDTGGVDPERARGSANVR